MDLFSIHNGSYFLPAKPRVASPDEVRAYLRWLAGKRGIAIPGNAIFTETGVYERTTANGCGERLLEMPRASTVVTCDILDDAGTVVRTMPLPVDGKGKLPMTAKQVQEWTGLDPVKVRKPRQSRAQAVTAPSTATPVEDAPAPVIAPVAAPEPAPAARPEWVQSESCHFAAGHKAATQGQPRALPSYFTTHHGQNARDWYRGFDHAAAELSAIAETPADIASEGDADTIAALDAEKAARLARASAAAVEALEAAGVTDPNSAGCDYIWPRFVTAYLGLQRDSEWHLEGHGKQRDRKARNRGAVMIGREMGDAIRAHFLALAPFQPAAVVEPEAVALPAPAPEPAAAAPMADDIAATLAALAARVTALEGVATGKRVRSEREARAIVRAWRMRAQARAARTDAAQARANETATRAQLQAQAREAMRLEETVEALRDDVTASEVRAHRVEQEADGLRTALATAQSDLAAARADMDTLAPLADVLASFAQRRAHAPALPTGDAA